MTQASFKRWVAFFGYWLAIITVCMALAMMVGCTYTHPSVAQPDLVEKLSTGHVVCYYRVGPSKGYAKCCEDCPMHENQPLTTTGGKP